MHIIDNKKAGILSRVLGLQLPTTLITSNFYKNISLAPSKVNTNFQKSVVQSLYKYQKEIVEKQLDVNNLERQHSQQER